MNLKCTPFNHIGVTIRTERTKANLTLSELEGLSGIAKGVISKIENGEMKHPDFQTVHALCLALQMTYNDIVNLYISTETKAEMLLPILQQCALEAPSLCVKMAKQILHDDQKDSYESIDELFSFVHTITDRTVQLNLYKLIISHTRLLGMQTFHAKALYQKYLIERDDFQHLRHTYDNGKSIVDYANFLTQEERGVFYYKLGVHAYHLNKYKEAIEILRKAEDFLNDKHAELKAWSFLYSSSSYCNIEQYDIAFAYLKLAQSYPFSFIKENIQYMTGRLNIKIGNIDIGIQQLQHCLKETSHKIDVINVLFDRYLQKEEWNKIKKLIAQEHEFLNLECNHPHRIQEKAMYYKKKSKYYKLQNCFDKHMKYLFKSATFYSKIGMNEKTMHCLEITYDKHLTVEQHGKVKALFKKFIEQYNKEVLE